jgi:hypothetical protein
MISGGNKYNFKCRLFLAINTLSNVVFSLVFQSYALGIALCLPIFAKITTMIPEEKKKPDAHHH